MFMFEDVLPTAQAVAGRFEPTGSREYSTLAALIVENESPSADVVSFSGGFIELTARSVTQMMLDRGSNLGRTADCHGSVEGSSPGGIFGYLNVLNAFRVSAKMLFQNPVIHYNVLRLCCLSLFMRLESLQGGSDMPVY
ncbi:hypothetical protein OG21DRAFT_1199260 [Imleria badia]|nr:hypothetical protein OG21DRAFT_1199260 [Imleria badia]